MVPDSAVSIDSTQSRTGVLTLAADARLVRRAVRVHDTLRPAVGWGADHLGEARTLAALSYYPRWIAVWTTRVWITRVDIFFYNR